MALGDSSGPQLRYTSATSASSASSASGAPRVDDVQAENTLAKALDLARRIEELLEDTRSVVAVNEPSAHSTRMARAMAASLVDELEALVRPSSPSRSNKTGTRDS